MVSIVFLGMVLLASRVGAFCVRGRRIALSTFTGEGWYSPSLPPFGSSPAHECIMMIQRQRTTNQQTSPFFASRRVKLMQQRFFSSSESGDVSDAEDETTSTPFQPGDKVQVEVLSFGPLGASVIVVGDSHDPDCVIPESQPPLGRGLILQKEIHYFRQGRQQVDVVRGEILPAYVERVRENGSLDLALRAFGGQAKADELATKILMRLNERPDGVLDVGDKSTPEDIQVEFPGVSKGSFKRAVATLYRLGKVQPGPFSIALMTAATSKEDDQEV